VFLAMFMFGLSSGCFPDRPGTRQAETAGPGRVGEISPAGIVSSGESADEGERGLRDFGPAVVDGQGVSAVRDLGEPGHAGVVLASLVFGR
jgi:hypothetical protein